MQRSIETCQSKQTFVITDGCIILLKILTILISYIAIFLFWLACDIDKLLFCMVSLSLSILFTAL